MVIYVEQALVLICIMHLNTISLMNRTTGPWKCLALKYKMQRSEKTTTEYLKVKRSNFKPWVTVVFLYVGFSATLQLYSSFYLDLALHVVTDWNSC